MRSMTRLFVHIAFICFLCKLCESYRILVVFPMPGKSHATLGNSCVQLLLEAGHQVTYIRWEPNIEPHPNLTLIDVSLPGSLEDRYSLKSSLSGEVNLNNMYEFTSLMSTLQRKILEHDDVQKLLHDVTENFDVAILEWLYGEYIVGLPAVFGCPYIWLSSMEPHSMILGLIGEITNPAYTAMNFFYTIPPFSFVDRVISLKDQLSLYLYRDFYNQPIEERDYQQLIAPLIAKRRGIVPSYNELRYNASLVLGNSHISVGRAVQLPQAYKAIGGYHVRNNQEPLPKDLSLLLDNSSNGVIYFSMGSFFKSKDLPDRTIEKILKIFSGLKQTVVWKFEDDLLEKPNNVHIVPWAPQQKILAHPNCILFISHGGQLSTLEAVHYGIPLIGTPVFVDQHTNVKTLVMRGMAKEVDIFNLAEDLKTAIEEILGNPSYTKAAKFQSVIYHHRPLPPGAEMVYWVEHVVRTNGAAHLRSVSLIVPWYQKCYLDLAGLTVVVILLILAVKQLLLRQSNRLKPVNVKKVQ